VSRGLSIDEEYGLNVSVVRTDPFYPPPPFHPGLRYPEYPYSKKFIAPEPNPVYAAVRDALRLLGLDVQNFGTPSWNPFREILSDVTKVLVKPNFVNHFNPLSVERPYFEALVTQGAIIRPVLDYLALASRGDLEVVLADSPVQSADLEVLRRRTGIDSAIDFVQTESQGRCIISIVDFRETMMRIDERGALLGHVNLAGDPSGYIMVDLGCDSSFACFDGHEHLFRVSDYDPMRMSQMHSNGQHQYVLPKTILECGLFINVSKLKSHGKTGVTLSLKGVVGVAGDKSSLPHYRVGNPEQGGDECPATTLITSARQRWGYPLRCSGNTVWRMVRPVGKMLMRLNQLIHRGEPLANARDGDWYGNDTIWRTIHDLNRIVFFADRAGRLMNKPQRKYLALVDGVVGGDGDGPLRPNPVPAGLVVAGFDPLAVDIACTRLMGLDWQRIPLLARYDMSRKYPFSNFNGDLSKIMLRSSDPAYNRPLPYVSPVHRFRPSDGWKGHIELPADDLPH
jgi:hypothetical protein